MQVSKRNGVRSLGWCTGFLVALCSCVALADDPSAPGPFQAGRKDVTVTRPNGSTFTATLHYPATAPGVNTPFDPTGGPYPIVSFGHGFLQPVTQYQSTLGHLASHGYFAIASQSQGSIFPSHAAFAADMRSCLDWVIGQGGAGGAYAGSVASDRVAFSGHSMGGGCALLAAKDDPRERAVVTLAVADTNPSSIAAAASVASATRLIVGSQDTIVPPASTAAPMYANLPGPRQLATIVGGFHCGFTDGDFAFCDSGSITRAEQLAKTRALMTRFLDLHLRFDAPGVQDEWSGVWGPTSPAVEGVTLALDPGVTVVPATATVSGPAGGTGSVEVIVTNADPAPRAFDLLGAAFAPAVTPVLAGGAIAASVGAIAIPPDAQPGDAVVLSARSQADGATRGFAVVTLSPSPPCLDLDGDSVVGASDLALVLGAWGAAASDADLNRDGIVDATDLAALLGAWGSCR
ncbi:MAG: hypothetical protein U0572_12565 [Phycisphaerales bacterium]